MGTVSIDPMGRMSRDEYFLRLATLVSMRSTCARRHTGCVLVDKRNHIMATGYNGVPHGFNHCNGGWKCKGALDLPGKGLDQCLAIHAEANALLQCKDAYQVHVAYLTDSPCIHCLKLLLNSSCSRIVFSREYPHPQCRDLWYANRQIFNWVHLPLNWPFQLEESFFRSSEEASSSSTLKQPD